MCSVASIFLLLEDGRLNSAAKVIISGAGPGVKHTLVILILEMRERKRKEENRKNAIV